MPLANVPMIDYTIKFLRNNGVKSIFIFATSHKKTIDNYFRNVKFQGVDIKVISSEQCQR